MTANRQKTTYSSMKKASEQTLNEENGPGGEDL